MYQVRGGDFSNGREIIKYFGFPVISKFYYKRFWLGLGMNFQYNLNANFTDSVGNQYVSNVTNFNYELLFLLGYNFHLKKRHIIAVEIRTYIGFPNYTTNPNETLRTRMLSFLVGYNIKL